MPWDEGLVNSLVYDTPDPKTGRVLGYAKAINEALDIALAHDPGVFVLGQGVDDPGRMFGTTKGLQEKYGAARVFDTPLSEEGMMGVCTGAAMNGMRPVYMHNRPDFILLAFNQLVTHASKYHYMDNGQTTVPMVVWAAIGRGWGSGAQHSQSIQGLLLGVPGLKIVMPSTPYDAKGLMLAAIADNNPVLIFEHRWLMKKDGMVPEGFYTVPLGKGVYRRRGKDITIVGASHALEVALQAAAKLADEGIDAEVIDLRTLKPLDEQIISESLKMTGRLLVVDTGWAMGGVCAEIGCLAAEKWFHYLKAPVRRVGLPDVPTPAGYTLEQFYYPDAQKISGVVREMVKK
ncbi:alpha-ketoacid dehydrogenase subunit beta [Sulfuricaulis sp.]|jgi:pyruvate/2-oxoglutarate/acetoin dehydrogenase E1 component|uniref:alpha-ketoacid dehydrogenase subunit beta n=1 Tax=Sulfuricaulis sp. TaxID=2003553 RepID=UPI00355A90BD